MNLSKLSEYFGFTPLDQKRSTQLKKEYPFLLPKYNDQGVAEIQLGPHIVSLINEINSEHNPIGSCSCIYFEKRNTCHHLHFLIELIYINSKKPKNSTSNQAKKKAFPSIKKMLRNIDDDLLSSFVIQYGRKHKAFSLVLKARLLRSNTISDIERNYYMELMNQIIHQRSSPSSPLTIGQLSTFLDVVDVFLDEIELCKEEKDYLNFYYIILALLDRVNLVLYRTPKKSKNILPYWYKCHENLTFLIDQVDAPDLKDEILTSLSELACKVYYQFCDYALNIALVIIKHNREKEELFILGQDLITALKYKSESEWLNEHYATIIHLLHKIDKEELLHDFCQQQLLTSNIYIEVSKILELANQRSESSQILLIGHQILSNAGIHEAYICSNLKLWEKDVLYTEIYQHLKMYHSIRPLSEADLSKGFKSGFIKFIKSKDSLSNEILAKVYRYLEQAKLLLQTLDDIPLGQLKLYDNILWNEQPASIRQYYQKRIKVFLDEFHGNKASIFIANILNSINSKAPTNEFDQILNFITSEYSHRSGLISLTKQFKRSYF